MLNKLIQLAQKVKKLGQDDPRRIIHSFKVGFAITLVTLFYYWDPFYDGFGDNAMWAVLTVIVVFEFSVGCTLSRGLNRGMATFLAGALGFGAHHLAVLSGNKGQPILSAAFVFLVATTVTFVRFFPRMKARYDYGLLIFILTFCLISVSGYREPELIEMAHKRVSTILIGGFTAVFVCIFVCPVWAGSDLHHLVAGNIEKMAKFMEAFGDEYFMESEDEESKRGTNLQAYKSVLNSKQTEEVLANFARWEPRHGKFRFRHPWKQYLKVAGLTRQCAYRVEALHNYLNSRTQNTPEIFRGAIEEECVKISVETGIVLKELARTVRKMRLPPSPDCPNIARLKTSADNLKMLLKLGNCDDIDLLDILPSATVASLLLEIASCAEKISLSVHELAVLAKFKAGKGDEETAQERSLQRSNRISCTPSHHVVAME